MRFPVFGIHQMVLGCGTLALALALGAISPSAQAAHDDGLPGAGSTAHYVRLTSWYQGKLAYQSKVGLRESCVSANEIQKRPVAPLPSGGIPKVLSRTEVEIFYSPNRVLWVEKGERYAIDPIDCSLKSVPVHKMELSSKAGVCKADLVEKEATGQCSVRAHALASADTNDPDAPADYSRMPAEMRHMIPQLQAARQRAADTVRRRTGAAEVHAGVRCEVYRNEVAKTESCLARPASNATGTAIPYRMRALHGRFGLWLKETPDAPDDDWAHLQAQEVRLDMPVSGDRFTLPAGLKIKEFALPTPAIVPVPADVPVRR